MAGKSRTGEYAPADENLPRAKAPSGHGDSLFHRGGVRCVEVTVFLRRHIFYLLKFDRWHRYRMQPINTELRIALGLVYENNGVETISLRLEPSAGVSRYR